MRRAAKKSMTSPRGKAVWPHLNEPNTTFEPATYEVTLHVSAEDAAPFIKMLEEFYAEGYKHECEDKKKSKLQRYDMPWKPVEDDQGQPTGEVAFKFKNKQFYEIDGKQIENRVLLLDAKKKPLGGGEGTAPMVGGGSTLVVGFHPLVWFTPMLGCGLSLRLKAAQVIDLVEANFGGGAGEFDFAEEEGFESISTKASTPESDAVSDEDFNF